MPVSLGDLTMILETAGEQSVSQGADKVTNKIDQVRGGLAKYSEQLGKVEGRINFLKSSLATFGITSMASLGQGGFTQAIYGNKFEQQRSTMTGELLGGATSMGMMMGGAALGAKMGMLGGPIGGMIGGIIGSVAGEFIVPHVRELGNNIESMIKDVWNPQRIKSAEEFNKLEREISDFRRAIRSGEFHLQKKGFAYRRTHSEKEIENMRQSLVNKLIKEQDQAIRDGTYTKNRKAWTDRINAMRKADAATVLRESGYASEAAALTGFLQKKAKEEANAKVKEEIKKLEDAGYFLGGRKDLPGLKNRLYMEKYGGQTFFGRGYRKLSGEDDTSYAIKIQGMINAKVDEMFRVKFAEERAADKESNKYMWEN